MADMQEPPNPDRAPGSAAHAHRPAGGRQHLSAINNIQVIDATSASLSPGKTGNSQCRTPKTIATGRPVMSISACQKQLRAAEIFHKQTEARIENMKKAVLKANTSVKLLGEGMEQSKAKESVAQMVNLIQGLVRRSSDFKRDQDDAVVAMQALLSFNNENGCNSPVEKKRIISHFQNIEKTKHAQLEGEKRLDALLATIPKPAHPSRPTNVHSDSSVIPAPPQQSTSRPPAPLPASLASKQAAPTSSSLPSPRSPRRDNMTTDIDPAEPSSSPPDSCQKLGCAVRASGTQEENHKGSCWIEDNDEPLASPPKLPLRQVRQATPNSPSLVFLPSIPAPGSTAHERCDAQELHHGHETARGDFSKATIDAHHGLERRGNRDVRAKQSDISSMYGAGVGADVQEKVENIASGDGGDHTVTATMHGGERDMGSMREGLSRDGEVAENVRTAAAACSQSSSMAEGRRNKADDEDAVSGRLRVLEDITSPQGFHFRAGEVCTMVREGSMGWTLVRDVSGKLSWLPSDKVEVAADSSEGARDGDGSRAMQNALEAVMLNAALSDAGCGAETAPRASDAGAAASPGSQQNGISKSKGGAGVVGMALGRDSRGNIVVVALREDGPAHSNEMISPGDILLAIDSYTVHASDDLEQVSCMLSGPPGSAVTLVVEKPGGNRLVANLTRRVPALSSLTSPSHHSAPLSGNGISAPLSGGRKSACPPISPVLSSRSHSSPNPASPSVLIFSPQEGDALFNLSRLTPGRGTTQSSAIGQEGAEDMSSMSRLFSLSPSTSPCLSAELQTSNEHRTSRWCTSSSTDNRASKHADDYDYEDRIALSKMLSAISSQNRVARMLEAAANDLSNIKSPSSSNPNTHDPSSYPLNIVCDAMHPTLPLQAAKGPFVVSPSPVKRHDYRSRDVSPLGRTYSPLSLV